MRSDLGDPIRTLLDERERLRKEHLQGLGGLALIRSLAAAMDAAVAAVWEDIAGGRPGVALVALGGYGRGEMSPQSDVDLMVLHGGARDVGKLSEGVFYALWDAGFQVGHATRTVKECLRLGDQNLEAATSFLDVRCVAGDCDLFADFAEASLRRIRKRGAKFLSSLTASIAARYAEAGHASWMLEPNLKEGAGGLRDLHSIGWMVRVFFTEDGPGAMSPKEQDGIAAAAELLHRVRNHLHYVTGNRTDILQLVHQDPVARFLGYEPNGELPVDAFMRELYQRARTVEHVTASLSTELVAQRARRAPARDLPGLLRIESGRVTLAHPRPAIERRPEMPVRLYAAAAGERLPVARQAARWVEDELVRYTGELPWDDSVSEAFFELLAAGSTEALEAFDHSGALVRYLPEWEHVRCRPQHNVYHRFTVDVHAFQTVAVLSALVQEQDDEMVRRVWGDVSDRRLLLLAGFLHDVGKGLPGDHSDAGEKVALAIADRMGLGAGRRATLGWLVRNHLLLADTATRRDTGDENLVVEAAAAVGDAERLRMLFLLSVADGRATGPAAWTPWKATLVGELFTKVLRVLERADVTSREADETYRLRTTELREALSRYPEKQVRAHLGGMSRAYFLAFPTEDLIRHFALMAEPPRAGDVRLHVGRTEEPGVYEIVVVAADRPGLFSTISGAFALNRVSILAAQIFTREDGAALEAFRVTGAFELEIGDERWDRIGDDMRAVMAGRIQVDEQLRAKRAAYEARPSKGKRQPPQVIVDNAASDFDTVIEVHAADRIGLLYTITHALHDLGLDIHVAKVATYAEDVVDVFYVRDLEGQKVMEAAKIAEIERLVLGRLAE